MWQPGLKIRGKNGKGNKQHRRKNLDQFGISHLARRSGAEAVRRGGPAHQPCRAFAIEPEIIFLDEPFASLDEPTRETLVDDLHTILHQTKTPQ